MINYKMVPLAHVRVRDHDYAVYISLCLHTRSMHIFKYNEVCCEYDVFDVQEEATRFIEQPLPKPRARSK